MGLRPYGPGRLGGVGIVRWEDRFNQGPAVGRGCMDIEENQGRKGVSQDLEGD